MELHHPPQNRAEEYGVISRRFLTRRRAEGELHRVNEGLEQRVEERTRRLAEANRALQEARAGLERRVEERTAELAAANAGLALKNQGNETFVYSVSHDLRSPLVNLQGFSKELEKGCEQLAALLTEEGLPPAVRDRGRAVLAGRMAKSIRFIQAATLRLSGIIDALLRLSRAGRVVYQPQPVDLGPVVRRVVDALQGTIAARGAVVTVNELPPALGDPTALEQVFANLIGNALNYLDRGRAGHIEAGCTGGADGGPRTYYVKDNGLGIPEAARQKIFQAFHRAHPEAAAGEGLGLAIVRRIVERHRGKVWVESEVGAGSTFFVTLPGPARDDTYRPADDRGVHPG